ncbi:MAG TPA: type ISP restriction/modification enzyme [Nocardioidaceae bacterium]|nr:type ISP restriction/modification enzyme [Nocardioidaceae bacterium]
MPTTIHSVLDRLREAALDERDKGDRFERFMATYFRVEPAWSEQFSDVWLWKDWPGRDGHSDTGIDLVARQRDTGDLTAIQCKFYAESTTIAKGDIDSFLSASGKQGFSDRIIVTTTDRWGKNAEEAIKDQQLPVRRVDISELNDSKIVLTDFSWQTPEVISTAGPKQLRPHQEAALADVRRGFETSDRGRLVMACGTGKTFTSLKIAEDMVGAGGSVLFLVPSISLLSQSLREWVQECTVPIRPFAVCSDVKVGRREREDMSVVDLTQPATTSGAKLMERMARVDAEGRMTVLFSTYQSIEAVHDAQGLGLADFDLVICDEAHRTTGVTLAGEDESAFVRVHDKDFLKAQRRLYMTATPRLYDEASKKKAADAVAVVASMDDESTYGPLFHRLGFGDSVEQGLLSDYKVLVLAVDERAVSAQFQRQFADEGSELRLDDVAKLVGCWNGLSKRRLDRERLHADRAPMRRAVAFAGTINASKKVAAEFDQVAGKCVADARESGEPNPLDVDAEHVDGTFNVLERNRLLDWLKAGPADGDNTCRVLSNARCLSEGVDVPALDAVLFLSPRKSVVDVVQSVGRVMRKAPGKEYGYVILPIGIPADMPPEQALSDNKKYQVVWQVLNALRAHDDRFEAMVNKIDLNRAADDKLQIIGVPAPEGGDQPRDQQLGLPLVWNEDWRNAIYAKIVAKVGDRNYWEDWAKDIADIARRHETRIRSLLDDPDLDIDLLFAKFLAGLKANLNDGITRDNAIEMLAQHIITKPVFDALFEGYEFTEHNPVSIVMQDMLDALDEQGIDRESDTLDKFYASVAARAKGIDNAEGKQSIITQLYEKFFKNAFPKTAESLGIVYTPVQIVDFILRSVEHLLNTEFGASLTDEGVHVLDPFTGTGTFIVRLLQSGLISAGDLLRKYTNELHANEISLLAYYVAAVNIEATFHGLAGGEYLPFGGMVLTDTFQMHEENDTLDSGIFPTNNERVLAQLATEITVIVANPPYSAGQTSANDDNANVKYPTLDSRIEQTYAAQSANRTYRGLADSYIRAIRWASDRIGERGIVAYVSNGGYIDSNTADGLRQCLVEEFDAVYVYNLRGNARTAGEQRAKEKGNAFGAGSRATIAILFLVRNPAVVEDRERETQKHLGATAASSSQRGVLHYRDIGDYLSREQKLEIVDGDHLEDIDWRVIEPNQHGDWINQRRVDFIRFRAIGKEEAGVFASTSLGLMTNRDAWVYNASLHRLHESTRLLVKTVNEAIADGSVVAGTQIMDETRVKWSASLLSRASRGQTLELGNSDFRLAMYRPFVQEHVCVAEGLIHQPGRGLSYFPSAQHTNVGYYVVGPGSDKPFAAFATNLLPDLAMWGSSGGQFFPRWTYQAVDQATLEFDSGGSNASEVVQGYRRIDNITDAALAEFRATYGISTSSTRTTDSTSEITKDDIFYYVYGLLHSPAYRSEFAADLKKMLPRIPKVRDFRGIVEAGRALAELHVDYESITPYPLEEQVSGTLDDDYEHYGVEKMAFGKGGGRDKDRSVIVYNPRITLTGIPEEVYRYQLGSRSAVEWIMDRYRVRTDKASGIVNDPNDWSREHEQPRYIIDLLKRIVTVSIETMRVVDNLPPFEILTTET